MATSRLGECVTDVLTTWRLPCFCNWIKRQNVIYLFYIIKKWKVFAKIRFCSATERLSHAIWRDHIWSIQNIARHWLLIILNCLWLACRWIGVSCASVLSWITVLDQWFGLDQKIIKISNLIQTMKNSVCPKTKVIRRPNFSESRICQNIYRMFRSVDWTHDMIIVKWHLFI